ncbi:tetratricopeptide repeat protein [Sphingomonas sp. RB1R13]|uniref:tetratricopeptide repeat protein n=1 Tax=Sphingomonas sp. RB1R13 TaxID=3096159 RepID=UPI002FC95CB8
MILALLFAAATTNAATPVTPPTADLAEARAAATHSRSLWTLGGNLRLKAGDAATAAKDFDQGLAIPGGSPLERGELLLDRARAAHALGDLATAESRSAEAARLVPADPYLWYFRTVIAVAGGDVPRAKIAIARALTLAPNDATLLFEQGHVASLAGEDSAARTAWTKAIAADPNGPVGGAAREALGLAGVPLTVR